ncbi:hypothetical protein RRF57_008586 [Xylaria bambusicola]|uniref:Uncharacterized protein n=1 Tax=Xylaria bambusicola TaxID=326684 RepID=A0AAN7Z8G0_9PEZI
MDGAREGIMWGRARISEVMGVDCQRQFGVVIGFDGGHDDVQDRSSEYVETGEPEEISKG